MLINMGQSGLVLIKILTTVIARPTGPKGAQRRGNLQVTESGSERLLRFARNDHIIVKNVPLEAEWNYSDLRQEATSIHIR